MVSGDYLGMSLSIADMDTENLTYFGYCSEGEFRLQKCRECGFIRYPPGTACPWCANRSFEWVLVEGQGEVHSYGEVHHAVQKSLSEKVPYMILVVDLDVQKGKPTEHEALRVAGNLVDEDGELASPELIGRVGIGTRVRMVFHKVSNGLALPFWTLDKNTEQPGTPWRYPEN